MLHNISFIRESFIITCILGTNQLVLLWKILRGSQYREYYMKKAGRFQHILFANKQDFVLVILLIVRSNSNSSIINE